MVTDEQIANWLQYQGDMYLLDAVGGANLRTLLEEVQASRALIAPFAYTTKTSLEIMERSESRSGSFSLFLPFDGMDEIKGVEFVPLYAAPPITAMASVTRNDGAGFWEAICADVPAITKPAVAASVEFLHDLNDRERVVGFRVYDAARKEA